MQILYQCDNENCGHSSATMYAASLSLLFSVFFRVLSNRRYSTVRDMDNFCRVLQWSVADSCKELLGKLYTFGAECTHVPHPPIYRENGEDQLAPLKLSRLDYRRLT